MAAMVTLLISQPIGPAGGGSPGSSPSVGADRLAGGDQVEARGGFFLIDDELLFCDYGFQLELGCSAFWVHVWGVTRDDVGPWEEGLPWMAEGAAVYVPNRAIEGIWKGNRTVEVQRVSEVPPRERPEPEPNPPCPDGPGAGEALPEDGLAAEGALGALNQLLDQNSDRYAGVWWAHPAGYTPSDPWEAGRELVIATVEDPEAVRPELEAVFHFAFCVVRVEHSTQHLTEAAEALREPDGSWQAEVDAPHNRVLVRLLVLDDAAVQRLASHSDMVYVTPFLRRPQP
jgi:hypothetical protein